MLRLFIINRTIINRGCWEQGSKEDAGGYLMARPKRIEGEKTAYERMEDAFWEMLSEMPYNAMTGKEICARAQVSYNSFYYHFENLDDMATRLFKSLMVDELPMAVINAAGKHLSIVDKLASVPDFDKRFERIRLLAGSGSPFLIDLVRKSIIKAWLTAAGINEEDLTPADKVDFIFVFGGYTTLLGSNLASLNSEEFSTFFEREIGRGVINKITTLAERKQTEETHSA